MKKSAFAVVLCAATLSGCLSAPPDSAADRAALATAQAVASTTHDTAIRPVSLSASDRRAIEAEIRVVAAARRISLGHRVAVSHEDAPDAFGRVYEPYVFVCGWFTVLEWEADAPERMRQEGQIAFYATDSFGDSDWWVNTANFTTDDLLARCLRDGILLQDDDQEE